MLEDLPPAVETVFQAFRVCEFSTMANDGTPITVPVVARWDPDHARFLLTTSIGFPQKALNIRRNPRVAMLFSDSTGSGLKNPPVVLIQGKATAPDEVVAGVVGVEDYWRDAIFKRQPATEMLSANALSRKLMDWYYLRILILVKPINLYWWPAGDFTQPVQKVEIENVG